MTDHMENVVRTKEASTDTGVNHLLPRPPGTYTNAAAASIVLMLETAAAGIGKQNLDPQQKKDPQES